MNEAKGMINGSCDPSDQRRVRGREMKEGTERYGSCKRGLPGRPNGKEGGNHHFIWNNYYKLLIFECIPVNNIICPFPLIDIHIILMG